MAYNTSRETALRVCDSFRTLLQHRDAYVGAGIVSHGAGWSVRVNLYEPLEEFPSSETECVYVDGCAVYFQIVGRSIKREGDE